MRKELLDWAESKLGAIEVDDVFNMKEEVQRDKEGRPVRNITLFYKKKKGIKQAWLEKETFDVWRQEIKDIVGDNLTLRIFSTEGNEMRHIGGEYRDKDGGRDYGETEGNYYNYQFNLVIVKRC